MDKKKYYDQKSHAKARGIPFLLSKEEWWDIWQKSGHWEQRGRGVGQYCMARYGDKGPYAVDNVFIQLSSLNVRQAQIGNKNNVGIVRSAEYKEKVRNAKLGKLVIRNKIFATITCPHCSLQGKGGAMKRYHMDNCKAINIK